MTSEEPTLFDEVGSSHSQRPQHRIGIPVWAETLVLLAVAVVVAIVVKAFFVQAFFIPSESMEPLLQGGPAVKTDDRVLVEKPSYWLSGSPQRGDVVVFKDPGGWLTAEEAKESANPVTSALEKLGLFPSGGHLVKRVIGVAGDTVSCCDKQGRIEVNGKPLDEASYAQPGSIGGQPCYGPMPGRCHWTSGVVPDGYLFVMGDNRAHSADSSYHLCTKAVTDCSDSPWVPVDDIVGKVVARIWPMSRFGTIHRPSDFDDIPPAKEQSP